MTERLTQNPRNYLGGDLWVVAFLGQILALSKSVFLGQWKSVGMDSRLRQ